MSISSNETATLWHNQLLTYLDEQLNFFFNHIYLLLLVVIGGIGNILVIVIFGQKAFRTTARCANSSSSVYPFLFYMAISDTLYLTILFCLWLSNYVNVLHRPVICQLTLYLTYVCNFINAYYTIGFTAQRLCAVVEPFRVGHFLSWNRSRLLALLIIIFALILYSYLPFLIGIVNGKCYSRPEYRWINRYMDVVDCVLVFLIPYFMLMTMNTIIVISLRRMKQNRDDIFFHTHSKINQVRELTRRNASRKMTKLLLMVSTSYLIICAPYACVHSWRLLMINQKDQGNLKFLQKLENYFHSIYHISFAMNFYIYIFYGSKFRRELRRLILKSRQTLSHPFQAKKSMTVQRNRLKVNENRYSMSSLDGMLHTAVNRNSETHLIVFQNYFCCCRCQIIKK